MSLRRWSSVFASALACCAAAACGPPTPDPVPLLAGRSVAAWLDYPPSSGGAARAAVISRFGDALLDQDAVDSYRDAVPLLVASLADADAGVRATALWALGILERTALEATEAIAALANTDPDPAVRRAALEALSEVAPPPQAYAEAMLGAEGRKPGPPDPDPVRTEAASAAGLNAVARALADPEADVRKEAVDAIGHWGRHGRPHEQALAAFLRDPDPGTRYEAVISCNLTGASAGVILPGLLDIVREPPVGRVHKDVRPYTRRAAVSLIGKLGEGARSAIPVLEGLATDPEVGETVPGVLKKLGADVR